MRAGLVRQLLSALASAEEAQMKMFRLLVALAVLALPGLAYGDHCGIVRAPEMGQMSQLASGLFGLAGYIVIRRRKA